MDSSTSPQRQSLFEQPQFFHSNQKIKVSPHKLMMINKSCGSNSLINFKDEDENEDPQQLNLGLLQELNKEEVARVMSEINQSFNHSNTSLGIHHHYDKGTNSNTNKKRITSSFMTLNDKGQRNQHSNQKFMLSSQENSMSPKKSSRISEGHHTSSTLQTVQSQQELVDKH